MFNWRRSNLLSKNPSCFQKHWQSKVNPLQKQKPIINLSKKPICLNKLRLSRLTLSMNFLPPKKQQMNLLMNHGRLQWRLNLSKKSNHRQQSRLNLSKKSYPQSQLSRLSLSTKLRLKLSDKTNHRRHSRLNLSKKSYSQSQLQRLSLSNKSRLKLSKKTKHRQLLRLNLLKKSLSQSQLLMSWKSQLKKFNRQKNLQ